MQFRIRLPLMACALLWALCSTPAFTITPITMEFEPSGRGASRTFRLDNDSDSSVGVEIQILTRVMAQDGTEKNEPATNEFTIFPTQVVLGPKKSQNVRVSWKGAPNPEHELAYRIMAEQLPVNLTANEAQGARLNLVVRYMGTIYIVPPGAKPDVVVESVTVEKCDVADERLIVVLHNKGTAHGLLRDLKLQITSGEKTVELAGDQLKGMANENVLAGSKRRFVIPKPEGIPAGKVDVKIDFNSKP